MKPEENFTGKKFIVILNGTGGSGKNTFADFVDELTPTEHISMVDCVKNYVLKMGLTSPTKNEAYRRFLSDIKLALETYDDIPYKNVKQKIREFYALSNDNEILFIDSREPTDIERFRREVKTFVVLVHNPRIADITSNMADTSVYETSYDYIVENDGDLSKLRESAKTFYEALNNNEI